MKAAKTNATDIVGGNNGATNGNVVAAGEVGQCFVFDGTKCIQVPDSPSLDPTNALTPEGWFYASSLPVYRVRMCDEGNPGPNNPVPTYVV